MSGTALGIQPLHGLAISILVFSSVHIRAAMSFSGMMSIGRMMVFGLNLQAAEKSDFGHPAA